MILTSETYDTKKAAEKGIAAVRKSAANEMRFEKRETKNGEQYFVLKSANGQPIGKSETYKTKKSADNGISSVQRNAPEAVFVESTV